VSVKTVVASISMQCPGRLRVEDHDCQRRSVAECGGVSALAYGSARVGRLRGAGPEMARGRPVTIVVVLGAKPIESRPLSLEVARRRARPLRFQRAVHALVVVVLFGIGRLDQFWVDGKPDLSHGE
jgi:hypothetical protein